MMGAAVAALAHLMSRRRSIKQKYQLLMMNANGKRNNAKTINYEKSDTYNGYCWSTGSARAFSGCGDDARRGGAQWRW